MEQKYTFLRSLRTNEIHIFKAKDKNGKCLVLEKSICNKMNRIEFDSSFNSDCYDEKTTRIKAAKAQNIGNDVCGICISHLYGNFDYFF